VLGATLMIAQSFLYNAIFCTYTLVLTKFYHVSTANAPLYLILFAAGNLLGPLAIGRFFDTIGRKQMIAATYLGSGAMLAVTAVLFDHHVLTATTQTIAWCVIFFFASAGASSAYLTVSEVFPLELRAQAIAVFSRSRSASAPSGPSSTATDRKRRKHHQPACRLPHRRGSDGARRPRRHPPRGRRAGKSLEDIANPLSMVRRPVHSASGTTSGSAGQVWRPNQADWPPDWLASRILAASGWRAHSPGETAVAMLPCQIVAGNPARAGRSVRSETAKLSEQVPGAREQREQLADDRDALLAQPGDQVDGSGQDDGAEQV
jgi:hypothetical protein